VTLGGGGAARGVAGSGGGGIGSGGDGSRGAANGGEPDSRDGFVLPLVILLLPAFLALTFSAFVLARGQLELVTMDGRLVEELAAAHPPPTLFPAPGEEVFVLEAGFLLLQAAPGSMAEGRRGHRVGWMPEPALLAGAWALTPDGPPDLGPIPFPRVLASALAEGPGSAEGQGAEELAEGEWVLPSGQRVRAEGGVLLAPEGGPVLVLAPGSIQVTGEGPLPGVMMAGGDVVLAGEIAMTGAIRAHGSVGFDVGARFVPDSAVTHAALSHPLLLRPHLIPGGERLGRH
jgi:hypothetical protein